MEETDIPIRLKKIKKNLKKIIYLKIICLFFLALYKMEKKS